MQRRALVLVAEDDSGVREILRTQLQTAGHDVIVARTGVEAVNKLRQHDVDCMVLDINMPELDGFSVLEMRGKEPRISVPTMVLTARHASDDVRKAVSLGAKDYLTKPFTEAQLVQRVRRLLRWPKVILQA